MRAKTSSRERTFIEEARRAQIIAAGIEVIAEIGSARASFARIAEQAGLSSTGLISYHFAGRTELLAEISRTVLASFAAYVGPRVDAQTTARAALAAFLESNVEFMASHRTQLLAYLDISRATPTGPHDAYLESDLAGLEELFREGQRDGEFRDFDPRVMAVAIRSTRDGVLDHLARHPDLDLAPYTRGLVDLFDHATRAARA